MNPQVDRVVREPGGRDDGRYAAPSNLHGFGGSPVPPHPLVHEREGRSRKPVGRFPVPWVRIPPPPLTDDAICLCKRVTPLCHCSRPLPVPHQRCLHSSPGGRAGHRERRLGRSLDRGHRNPLLDESRQEPRQTQRSNSPARLQVPKGRELTFVSSLTAWWLEPNWDAICLSPLPSRSKARTWWTRGVRSRGEGSANRASRRPTSPATNLTSVRSRGLISQPRGCAPGSPPSGRPTRRPHLVLECTQPLLGGEIWSLNFLTIGIAFVIVRNVPYRKISKSNRSSLLKAMPRRASECLQAQASPRWRCPPI